jgi:hypothetical protein
MSTVEICNKVPPAVPTGRLIQAAVSPPFS